MGGIWAEEFMKLPREIIRIQTHIKITNVCSSSKIQTVFQNSQMELSSG